MRSREVLAAIENTRDSLGADEASVWVLDRLALLEINAEFAAELGADAARGIPWELFVRADEVEGPTPEGIEAAIHGLSAWGLVVVDCAGAGSGLRLSTVGKACVGLAPAGRRAASDTQLRWRILHGPTREALLLQARREVVPAPVLDARASGLAGRLALALVTQGAAIVDASGEGAPVPALREVLTLGAHARRPRLLLCDHPRDLRFEAFEAGAELRWVPPPAGAASGLEPEITRALGAPIDAIGSPGGDVRLVGVPADNWDMLVMPQAVSHQLRQVLAHARHRLAAGEGYRLLLSGLPGTGKTATASALAARLQRTLVRLDLSATLSRWLGETEKNLAYTFDFAETSGSVLVLDEAEALLRQRDSESQPALATAVAYTLGRIERFSGVLVATTNRVADLDEAFFRRFEDYLVLPLPDERSRARLWHRHLGADHGVDVERVAREWSMSGGLIVQSARRARAWAEAAGAGPDTAMVVASVARELEKAQKDRSRALSGPLRPAVLSHLEGQGEEP